MCFQILRNEPTKNPTTLRKGNPFLSLVTSHLYAYWLPSDDSCCIEAEEGPEMCSVTTF